jgi:4-hydroxybenzoate polyprenyltransferase/phosphoglycolate phosphatase-like HAD superfamily hydrolase
MGIRAHDAARISIEPEIFPLIVDLDGTLTKTDLLHENFFESLTQGLKRHVSACIVVRQGKAQLKAALAEASSIDYELLPYNESVLTLIQEAREQGRPVYLATASDQRHAEGVAAHLGLFDGIFASDGVTNFSGKTKAAKLVESFGEGRFDYVGNDSVDLAIWAHARMAYAVDAGPGVARKIADLGIPVEHLTRNVESPRIWLKALRVHQYAKNMLVFVPLLTSHSYIATAFLQAGLAFAAFSLCASAVYILNDLIDLDADRRHPVKYKRPFASGAIPLAHGAAAIPLLLILAFGGALATSVPFAGVLAGYFLLTLAYSLKLKRKLIVDVVVLASLYTIRVIAGAAVIGVPVSEWLLAFSMFIFTCLALIKRYVELAARVDNNLPDPTNRGYKLADNPIVGMLAAASGLNAVTIFALYICEFRFNPAGDSDLMPATIPI